MADQDKKEENLKSIPERISNNDQAERFRNESGDAESITERREIISDDQRVSRELRKEIEMMELDDDGKKEAEKKAEKIEFLGEKEKITHLLEIAREKGLIFAIQVAKKMNEPYLLDILHDTLAQEGFYQKIMRPTDDDNSDDKKTK